MYEIAIIGGGPAGASAGIYTAKAGKKTLIIDNGKSVTKRALVRNHYGVKEITGPELFDTGIAQAKQYGAEFVETETTNIKKSGDVFTIETEDGEYQASYIILATGMSVQLAEKMGVKTKPATEPRIKTVLDLDSAGKTNIEGVWGAGTVAGVSMHTIITAGDGAKVAINLISEINGERYVDHDMMGR